MRLSTTLFMAAGLAACSVPAAPDEAAPPAAAEVDPRVAPGLVRWHADLDAACAAAGASGRPVLLFALLGDLDRERC
jgi:hypothetical protein